MESYQMSFAFKANQINIPDLLGITYAVEGYHPMTPWVIRNDGNLTYGRHFPYIADEAWCAMKTETGTGEVTVTAMARSSGLGEKDLKVIVESMMIDPIKARMGEAGIELPQQLN